MFRIPDIWLTKSTCGYKILKNYKLQFNDCYDDMFKEKGPKTDPIFYIGETR